MEQNKEDFSQPRPSVLSIIWKVLSAFVQMLINNSAAEKAKKQSRLADWKNHYIERRNKRIARATMMKSAEELAKSRTEDLNKALARDDKFMCKTRNYYLKQQAKIK